MRQYLSSSGAALDRERLGWWGLMAFETRLFWDRVNYAWQDAVVEYNEEFQRSWLASLGLESGTWWHLLLLSLGLLTAGLATISLLLRRRGRESDPWRHAWRQLCQKLARAGHPPCRPAEGPLSYVKRVSPDNAPLLAMARLYAEGRYGASDGMEGSLHSFRSQAKAMAAKLSPSGTKRG
jgi:hypothetical protein